jgi:hypothetical protein
MGKESRVLGSRSRAAVALDRLREGIVNGLGHHPANDIDRIRDELPME